MFTSSPIEKTCLQKAELNSSTAFATPQALEESVRRLEALNATEDCMAHAYCPSSIQ